MSMEQFNSLTPQEFNQAVRGYRDKVQIDLDNQLWQTRFLAAMVLNSSQRMKKVIRPDELFKLPGERRRVNEKPVMSKEQAAEAFKKLQDRFKKAD